MLRGTVTPVIVGRYSLEREIGRGGMGAVWLGHDEVLGRKVALKRIGMLPGADSTDLARAEREARLTARLNHPHVVGVYNLVVDPESRRPVAGHGVRRRLHARPAGAGRGPALTRRRGAAAAADGRRPRRRARGRHRAPRREAVEHPGRPQPPREAHRLRHRPDHLGPVADPDRHGHRLAGVPRPRDRRRSARRRGGRRVVAGRHARSTRCPGGRRTRSATRCSAGSTGSSTRSRRGCRTPAG